jgi:hypothetical protein
MPAMTLTEKKQHLMKMLEVVLEHLQEQGLLPKDMDEHEKHELLDNVAEKLLNKSEHIELSLKHDADGSMKNALSLCLITEFVAMHNPTFKSEYNQLELEQLFDKDLSLQEQRLVLEHHFTVLLSALNNLISEPKLRVENDIIQQQAKELALQCTQIDSEACLAENKAITNITAVIINDLLADTLTETLSNLFGGLDPRHPGVTIKPVLVENGNPMGIPNENTTNVEINKAFMAVISRPEGNELLGIKTPLAYQLELTNTALEEKLDEVISAAYAPKPDSHSRA